ncbi:hypothetical protein H0H81_002427 [Sphagnurus paluster]|uniref:Uncharacterized protein n=1 Tax=Sphagnurus paluster TaxID=117069 RepID=A0A9P7FT36_9AGAR|nr:hypothetical protein H0H81_002427 [Sphagnurus paluster]
MEKAAEMSQNPENGTENQESEDGAAEETLDSLQGVDQGIYHCADCGWEVVNRICANCAIELVWEKEDEPLLPAEPLPTDPLPSATSYLAHRGATLGMMEVFSLQYSNSEGISASANEKLREVFYEDGVGFFGGVLEDALGDPEKWETVLKSDSPEDTEEDEEDVIGEEGFNTVADASLEVALADDFLYPEYDAGGD